MCPLAQLEVRLTLDQEVLGSSPRGAATVPPGRGLRFGGILYEMLFSRRVGVLQALADVDN